MHYLHRIGFFLFSILLFVPSLAYGWDAEGHRIVAQIAANELSPVARVAVQDLLGPGDVGQRMTDASTWADSIKRYRPDTRSWHYVDIEINSTGYNRNRDCPNDACIVEQIRRETKILRDRRLLRPVRAEALRFLIHFMGDLHQPLHCADNLDRGGNEVRVILRRHRTNLHAVWDREVVQALGRSPAQIATAFARGMNHQDVLQWQRGSIESWTDETFRVAQRRVYSQLADHGPYELILPPNYPRDQKKLVQVQLEKAGVRLAFVLNGIFATAGTQP